MIITASKLREEVKEAFPSLKAFFCEYVECLDEKYLIPSYDESIELIEKCWEPIKAVKREDNIGDCDNRAIKLYADVHWHRVLNIKNIPEDERIQWSFGVASGLTPFGIMHTFNLIRNDRGLYVFDNKIKQTISYQPISVRF
ncbi:MAG: hypothetical protein SVK08_01460 [Halobacteriota archaeon]|nr:hypothetical protein [Halobacteriota archaeon]